jgi:hypothetical protein
MAATASCHSQRHFEGMRDGLVPQAVEQRRGQRQCLLCLHQKKI